MTLLEAITRAAAEAVGGENPTLPPKFYVILNSDEIFLQLKPNVDNPDSSSLIKRVSGWKLSEIDSAIAQLTSRFAEKLRGNIRRRKAFDRVEFLALLNSFLTKIAERIGYSIDSDATDPSGTQFARVGIKKLGFLLGREVAGLIAECCTVLQVWEVFETLLIEGLVGYLNTTNLTGILVEKNQTASLCLLVKHVPHLRSSELLSALKHFLSPTDDSYDGMVSVRKQWESEALLAVEKATQARLPKKVSKLAREASILLMMACDNFLPSQVCLHYVFGSSNADGIVLSAAIAKLDGHEVLDLVRYFLKWLRKYLRFPEACRCPLGGAKLGLRTCESVPSLESIVKGLRMVLDEHFSYLVFNSEFHDEMIAAENVVSSLVLEAGQSYPLDEVIKHLLSEIRKKNEVLREQFV